jgi:hypothetical protein
LAQLAIDLPKFAGIAAPDLVGRRSGHISSRRRLDDPARGDGQRHLIYKRWRERKQWLCTVSGNIRRHASKADGHVSATRDRRRTQWLAKIEPSIFS